MVISIGASNVVERASATSKKTQTNVIARATIGLSSFSSAAVHLSNRHPYHLETSFMRPFFLTAAVAKASMTASARSGEGKPLAFI